MKFIPSKAGQDAVVLTIVHRDGSVLAEIKHPPDGQVSLHIKDHPFINNKSTKNGAPLGQHVRYFKTRSDAQKFVKDIFK